MVPSPEAKKYGYTGVELAVVAHGRVDDFQTVKLVQNLADGFRLPGIGQVSYADGIKQIIYRWCSDCFTHIIILNNSVK